MSFAPDSTLVSRLHPSPNVEPRRPGFTIDTLILHYTGLPDAATAIDVLSRPDCKVSCHYVLDLDGTVIQMVPEALRAWHAGLSVWHGVTDINSCSIGIEIQNVGHTAGYPDFPDVQMGVLEALCRDICARNTIRPERVLAHSDIAPARKHDPGEKLDWKRLAQAGVGHWVSPIALDPADVGIGRGATDRQVSEMQALLASYGYGVPQTGCLDAATEQVVTAFQRHFRPARVDGCIDASCLATIGRLIAALPASRVA